MPTKALQWPERLLKVLVSARDSNPGPQGGESACYYLDGHVNNFINKIMNDEVRD